jgi:hypothetical protein
MYLTLFAFVEIYVFARWINDYVILFLVLLYALWYFDGSEYTGRRRWNGFRAFRVWRVFTPMEYTMCDEAALAAISATRTPTRRLYLAVPGTTLVPLVWGVGLHGGALSFADNLVYVVPPAYMWVPLVRDVLLWTGAVTWHPRKLPLTTLLLDLLNSNCSVICYASEYNGGGDDVAARIPQDLLDFAHQEHIQLVPVITHNESKRYRIHKVILPPAIALPLHAHLGYAYPCVFWFRLFTPHKAPALQLQFGPIINPSEIYETPGVLRQTIINSIQRLACPELGDDTIKLE